VAINYCCGSYFFTIRYSTSKEYAELEWPIDIAIALIGCFWDQYDWYKT
jgi:cbb3-type cytochrome oxidase subunit 1